MNTNTEHNLTTSLLEKAQKNYKQGSYDKAFALARQAEKLSDEISDKLGLATACNLLGVIYRKWGIYERALELHFKALQILKGLNQQAELAITYNNLGNIYKRLQQYEKALDYLQRSFNIKQEIGDYEGMSISLNNIGTIRKHLGDANQAAACYTRAIEISEAHKLERSQAYALMYLGEVSTDQGKHAQALSTLKQAHKLINKTPDTFLSCRIHLSMGIALLRQGDPKAALEPTTTALELANQENLYEQSLKCYQVFSEIYEIQGDLSQALKFQRLATRTINILTTNNTNKAIGEIQYAYELESTRQKAEIYRLETQELSQINKALKAEVEQRQRWEEAYRTLVDNSLQAILVVKDGKFSFGNKELQRILGYDVNELEAMSSEQCYNIIHPDDREMIANFYQQRVAGQPAPDRYSLRVITKQGKERWLDVSSRLIEFDGTKAVQAVFADITESLAAQRQLEKSREKYSLSFESAPGLMALVNLTNAEISEMNSNLTRLIGLPQNGIMGYTLNDLGIFTPQQIDKLLNLGPGDSEHGIEITVTKAWGKLTCLFSAVTIELEDERFLLLSGLDITQRKQVEEFLRKEKERADKAMRVKDDFLANMSHELRTPLNAISGFSQLLATANLDPRLSEYVDYIQKASGAFSSLVNDLLDMAGVSEDDISWQNVSPWEVFHDLAEEYATPALNKKLQLVLDCSPDLQQHFALDKRKLYKIVGQLLGNAIKFSDEGTITVTAELLQMEEKPMLRCSVKDLGRGIPRGSHEDIFNQFYMVDSTLTRSSQGTGIGLFLARQLARQLGGELYLARSDQDGSEFVLELPLVSPKPLPAYPIVSMEAPPVLLIAESDSLNEKLLQALARACGWKSYIAENLTSLTELLQKHKPHLLLVDTGFGSKTPAQLIELVQQSGAKPLVGAVSDGARYNTQQLLDSGFGGVLLKPIDFMELKRLMGICFTN